MTPATRWGVFTSFVGAANAAMQRRRDGPANAASQSRRDGSANAATQSRRDSTTDAPTQSRRDSNANAPTQSRRDGAWFCGVYASGGRHSQTPAHTESSMRRRPWGFCQPRRSCMRRMYTTRLRSRKVPGAEHPLEDCPSRINQRGAKFTPPPRGTRELPPPHPPPRTRLQTLGVFKSSHQIGRAHV